MSKIETFRWTIVSLPTYLWTSTDHKNNSIWCKADKIIGRFRASAHLHGLLNPGGQALIKDLGMILKVKHLAENGWSSMNYPKHQEMNWSLSESKVLARSIVNLTTGTNLGKNLVFRSWTLHYKFGRSGLGLWLGSLHFKVLGQQLICSTIALNGWYATQSPAAI